MEKSETLLAVLIGVSLIFSILMIGENTRWIKRLMCVLELSYKLHKKGDINDKAMKELLKVLEPENKKRR